MAAAARVLLHNSDQDEAGLVSSALLPGAWTWPCSLLPAAPGHVPVPQSLRRLAGWTGGAGGLAGRACAGEAGVAVSEF